MNTTLGFGQWLRQQRKALGLTQKELAQQAGCAEVTLRKIESGDLQPSAPLVASLARALGVADADLPGLVSLARGVEDDFTARARLLRPQRPNNLPAQLTPLIGRSRDITAVRKRLIDDGARLVTLVGPPGVGKTRLSLAVAEDVLEQFDDGVFFVRLAPVSDPAQVASAIAQALGMEMGGPNPPELQLRAYLEEKHLLLALDNFEQILPAAPLVDDLLRRCLWLHVLVTSRQPLRVRGERQVIVRPLPLPAAAPEGSPVTAQDMLRYPAVALFADRAEAVLPDFAVDDDNAAAVAELCRRLDGLPLAIELVAARVKLLPPAALLARLHGSWLLSTDGLRDVSARQKTLRGAIGWSYDLLSPAEQTLFTYLSVFVGGFTLEAAELLCGDTLAPALPLVFSPIQVLEGIGSLLDKSLLHRAIGTYDEQRYEIHEILRQYALERLHAVGLDNAFRVKLRHLHYYVALTQKIEPKPGSSMKERIKALTRLDIESSNLRSALAWSLESRNLDKGLQLVASLDWFWSMRSHLLGEVVRSLEGLLLSDETQIPSSTRAKAFRLLAQLLYNQGDDIGARPAQEQALTLWQELGYEPGIVESLMFLGGSAMYRGDKMTARKQLAAARLICEDKLSNLRKEGATLHIASTLHALGELARAEGNYTIARSYYEECLVLDDELGNDLGMANTQHNLARVAFSMGDYQRAAVLLGECLEVWQQIGIHRSVIDCVTGIAAIAGRTGHLVRAVMLFGAADALGVMFDLRMDYIDRIEHERNLAATRGALRQTDFQTAWEAGRRMTMPEAVQEAFTIIATVRDTGFAAF